MAKKPPDKGSVLWHKLPSAPEGYEDVEIGVRFVGAHKARSWMIQMQKISMEEKSRKLKLGTDDNTMEYVEALDKLTKEVLGECVAGAKNVEGVKDDDAAAALELLEFLGAEVEIATLNLCQEQQSLSLRQRFRPEAASN